MLYEYAKLKGIIRKGDRVRAVPGKYNVCAELKDDGSNEMEITEAHDAYFAINGCYHHYIEDYYLDLNPPKILDDLQVGDEVMLAQYTHMVLARVNDCILMSVGVQKDKYTQGDDWKTEANYWNHIEELKRAGYTLPTPEPTKVELTVGELEEKLQMPSGTLRIKKD